LDRLHDLAELKQTRNKLRFFAGKKPVTARGARAVLRKTAELQFLCPYSTSRIGVLLKRGDYNYFWFFLG
jgi:hypothetical protein